MHASVAGHMQNLIVQAWCSKLSHASAANPFNAPRIQVHTCWGAAGLPPACRRRANGAVGATTGASRRTICRCGASWTGARRVRCARQKVKPLHHTDISIIHMHMFIAPVCTSCMHNFIVPALRVPEGETTSSYRHFHYTLAHVYRSCPNGWNSR